MHEFDIGVKERDGDFVVLHSTEQSRPEMVEHMIQTRNLPFDVPPRDDGEPRKGLSVRYKGQIWFVAFED